jgi:ABC-2 type transport system permease protein
MHANGKFSLTRLKHIVKKELRQLLRDPKAKPLIFVAPLVQMLLLGYAATTDVKSIPTMVVDHDRTEESRALVAAFTSTGYFAVAERTDRGADVAPALDRGRVSAAITIPPGFSRDMRSGRGATIQAVVDGSDASLARVAQSYATQIARQFGAKVMGAPGATAGVELRSRAWFNPSLESKFFNVPAIMGVIIMMMCLVLTSLGVVREREVGTLDQLLVSPIRPAEFMLGKTIPVLCVNAVHLLICSAMTVLHFGIPMRGSIGVLALAALVYAAAGLAFGLLISTVSKTQQEAFMLLVLFLLPAVMLAGFISPVDSMPTVFKWIAALNPIRYFLEIARGVFLKGIGLAELWPHFAVLASMATIAMVAAMRRFRMIVA